MDQVGFLRTGAFARASSLSLKALRLYRESGLLVPATVEPDTGYRAYSPSQLTDAAIIRALREVGVSLNDIRAVLAAHDVDVVRKVLTEQAVRLQASLDAVESLVDDLYLGETGDEAGIELRHEPARIVLAVDGDPLLADLGPFLLRSEATLREAASTSGAVVDGDFGASYPPPSDDRQEVTAYLPISAPVLLSPQFRGARVRVDELPACDVAALEYRGPYTGLEACYRRLGLWVAFHAAASDQPVREWYVTPIGAFEEAPTTELLWPVRGEGTR